MSPASADAEPTRWWAMFTAIILSTMRSIAVFWSDVSESALGAAAASSLYCSPTRCVFRASSPCICSV